MTLDGFRASLSHGEPPPELHGPLLALWWDAKADWDRAHAAVADDRTEAAAWVHAYLHRKEGDNGNARYWYRVAKKPAGAGPLTSEWEAIVSALVTCEVGPRQARSAPESSPP